jgi:hypothetical protein
MGNVLARGNHDMVVPLPLPSKTAAQVLRKYAVTADLIYVNGADEYVGVFEDLKAYYPSLTPNGLMFGEDFAQGPVADAVHDFTIHLRRTNVFQHDSKWLLSQDPCRVPEFTAAERARASIVITSVKPR